ncbi:uncharacterized protein LOC116949425 [Petromyzon marinus]|uniref:uncharacterized protein LOC116949425 n=1 Tax=Petromyzon marinus TaxID=7757 RepID=UPI003F713A0A
MRSRHACASGASVQQQLLLLLLAALRVHKAAATGAASAIADGAHGRNIIVLEEGCTPFPMPPDRTCLGPRGPGHPSVSVSPERPSQAGRDALRLSWSPSPHRHNRLKGFQVTLLGLTGDMGRWTCWEVLLRKVPPDTQFLLTSHDLRLGVNYSITIQTLPPAGVDCPQNSHTMLHYHTRSCEEILSLEGPSLEDFCIPDWKPAQVNASVDGSTVTVKFWVATPVHRVRGYNLYLGKPHDSDVPDFYAWFPRIFTMATVQGEQVNEKFASHTFRDLKPGDYTVQVAAQKVDAIRSKPTLFTISEGPETPPAPRAATACALPSGKREREKCAEEKGLLGKSGSSSRDEVSRLKKEIKKLNSKFARLKKKAQRPRKKKRRQRPAGSY